MILRCNLIITFNGNIRLTKRMPPLGSLREDEVVIPLTITIGDDWFRRRTPVINLDIADPETPEPVEVVADEPT